MFMAGSLLVSSFLKLFVQCHFQREETTLAGRLNQHGGCHRCRPPDSAQAPTRPDGSEDRPSLPLEGARKGGFACFAKRHLGLETLQSLSLNPRIGDLSMFPPCSDSEGRVRKFPEHKLALKSSLERCTRDRESTFVCLRKKGLSSWDQCFQSPIVLVLALFLPREPGYSFFLVTCKEKNFVGKPVVFEMTIGT